MSGTLTIRAVGTSPSFAAHRAAIASLPASLRLVAEGQADIALVGPDAASIAAGRALAPHALVVADPARVTPAEAESLADADLPSFAALRLPPILHQADAGPALAEAGLVRSHLLWRGARREALFEHFAGLSAVLGPLLAIRCLAEGTAYAGTAQAGNGVTVHWSGQGDAQASHFELDVIGLPMRLEIEADLDDTARPARIRTGSATGLHQPRGVFESGLRLFWRSVLADLDGRPSACRWRGLAALHALSERLG